jgi:glycosyltransferase involved in cell wall biosynthesis
MKVLHVIPSISPLRGGPSEAVLAMVSALRATGVDACILTTNDHGPSVDTSMPIGRWFERAGVPILAFQRWSPPIAPLREFAICPGLNQWLARHISNYDILHIHALFSWPSTTAMLQARRAHVPYVLRTIGQLNHWSLEQSRGRKKLLWRLIELRNVAGASALHFTSFDERQQALSSVVPQHCFVLPLGVSLPPLDSGAGPGIPELTTFLFLSRVHPKKQIDKLIDALALLMKRRPDAQWRLQIAGEASASYRAELGHQIAVLGLSSRCEWLGFLEGTPKWQVLQSADWFVLPSASENFGIAAIEALAAGTPTILTPDVAVAGDIFSASAGLMTSAEPQALSEVLEGALGGPPKSMQVAARRMAADHYAWPAIASQLHQAYRTLL